jgi:citrate lyase subunit beta/citryl-CoA lyase
MLHLRRSVLYVPADNARALEKARDLPCDAIILDLEDAVAPEAKDAARAAATAPMSFGKPMALRINAAGTPWHEDDVAAAVAAGFTTIVLPKVRAADDVERLAERTGASVWPMIETARGVLDAPAVAATAARTGPAALVLGTNDLAAEIGAVPGPDRAAIGYALQRAVLAGRACDVDVLDGVFNDLGDADGLAAEATAARVLGMTGKTVIHPAQIDPVNAAFTPDAAAVAEARRIIEAMEAAEREGRAVATLDGRLVERLHAESARRTLAIAQAAAGGRP